MSTELRATTNLRTGFPRRAERADCTKIGGATPLDKAVDLLLTAAPEQDLETVALDQAAGRCLARGVYAVRDRPAHPLSAMDGYAIRGCEPPSLGRRFEVVGAAYPGAPFDREIGPGEAVRVTTGAPAPSGADRVIIDESVSLTGRTITVASEPGSKAHVRPKGSDFHRGQCLAPAGVRLSATTLMAAAASEAAVVSVTRRPRIALVSTGDELAHRGRPIGDHQIPDSISVAVAALFAAWGGRVVSQMRSADDSRSTARALERAAQDADIVVVLGGASGSERDGSRAAAASLGAEMLFEGLALKPGKPTWAAQRGRGLLIGLPGNPLAALVAARLLVTPVLAQVEGGEAADARRWAFAPTLSGIGSGASLEVVLGAHLDPEGVRILSRQDSASQSQLADLTAIVRRPASCLPSDVGDPVQYLIF